MKNFKTNLIACFIGLTPGLAFDATTTHKLLLIGSNQSRYGFRPIPLFFENQFRN